MMFLLPKSLAALLLTGLGLILSAPFLSATSPRPAPPKPLPLVMESSDGGFRKTMLWQGGKQRIGRKEALGTFSAYRKQIWWLDGMAYDIPVLNHPKVRRSVRRLIVNKRKQLIRGIKRSGKYLPMVRRMLQEEGMPLDLVYMVAQESNFNESARSWMNAVGLWQFMAHTGRRYGLSINRWIDERRDPILSTRAAIRYLKHLYDLFKDWKLAMAAYNAGENRVLGAQKKALRKGKPADFWSLKLPRETQEFVPSIMAQAIIYNQRKRYWLDYLKTAEPMDETRVKLPVSFSLEEVAQRAKTSFRKMRELNPALHLGFPPMNQDYYTLYLPRQNHGMLLASLKRDPKPTHHWNRTYSQLDIDSSRMTRVLEKHGLPVYFRVNRGDNIWDLAKKHKTTRSRLRRWNGLRRNAKLRVNQRLKIYVPTWKVFREIAKVPGKNKAPLYPLRIRVPRGAALSVIAERYRTSVRKLLRWNKLASPKSLQAGQQLIVGYTKRKPGAIKSLKKSRVIRVPANTTLSHLALRYKTSVRQLMRWNGMRSSKSLRAGQKLIVGYVPVKSASSKKTRRIKVPRNATLSHLALKYGTSVRQLMRWNGLKNPKQLRAGMSLVVAKAVGAADPPHHVIRVRSGDTLWEIARRFRTSVATLVALNDLKSKNRLQLNQRLVVPARPTNES